MNDIKSIDAVYNQQSVVGRIGNESQPKPQDNQSAQPQSGIPAPHDRVTLSDVARNSAIAMEEAKSLPTESDHDKKVAAIKEAVESGNYEIKAEEAAEKMVGEIINGYA